ncbi:MAG: S8 family peptidase, partial [Bacteroidota bacterium]
MRSHLARLGYAGLDGSGIKIGVISDSYNTIKEAADDIRNGDLPGKDNLYGITTPVDVIKEYPFGVRPDEGRAMLQIVHDVAPGATLAFRTGFITAGDFARGILEMQKAGCQVIVDDITYPTEPFFRDGKVAKAISEVTAQGVSYFTSAGNFGSKSVSGTFKPSAAPAGIIGYAHDFGGGDRFQRLLIEPGTYTIVLQWEDDVASLGTAANPMPGAKNDLDIYLTADEGVTRLGYNRKNIGGDPIEMITFTATSPTTTDLLIVRESGNENVRFKYVIVRGNGITINEYYDPAAASTVVGSANALDAITVGAVLYSNTPAWGYSRPEGVEEFTVATFSSRGGTYTEGAVRNKPDITGPNGANTTVNFSSKNMDYPDKPEGDSFPNFYGTSAAAPHVAAASALVLQAWNLFEEQSGALPPADLRQKIVNTALDMHETGFDFKSGTGLVRTDRAIQTFAAPAPKFDQLIFPEQTAGTAFTPGAEPFTVAVKGINFTSQSRFMMRDVQLVSRLDEETGYLQVDVPVFNGNPPLQVINDPISTSKLDGGSTAIFYFSDLPKKRIVIAADDVSKKYGANVPPFTAQVLVDVNGTLTPGILSLEDVGLTLSSTAYTDAKGRPIVPLTFSSPATALSNVRFTGYTILPNHGVTDIAFRDLYNYDSDNYRNGLLSVEKIPLLVRPNDITAIYGEPIANQVEMSYTFEGLDLQTSGISDENLEKITAKIQSEHNLQILQNTVAVVDVRG